MYVHGLLPHHHNRCAPTISPPIRTQLSAVDCHGPAPYSRYRIANSFTSTRWFIGAFFVISEMWAMKDCSTGNEALITYRLGIRWFGQT